MLITFVSASALTVGMMPAVLDRLRRAQVMDVPGERSSHTRVTVRGAGVATALASSLTAAWVGAARGPGAALWLLAVGVLFGVLGFVDDVKTLSARGRLVAQVGLAGLGLASMAAIAEPSPPLALVVPVGLVWLVAFVNAFNFMDGINGISIAQVVAAGTVWAWLGHTTERWGVVVASLALVGAALGFGPFNLPRARAFLGDVGSYHFGASLALIAAWLVWSGEPLDASLGALGCYLADTFFTLLRRARAGEALMEPHRSHSYQRLVDHGWSHARVACLVGGVSLASGAIGVIASSQDWAIRVGLDGIAVSVVLAYVALPFVLERTEPEVRPAS